MPRIYCARFPKGKDNSRKQKLLEISFILTFAIIVMIMIIKGINPILDKLCVDVSKKKATIISNQKATEVMEKYTYEDMVTIYRDNDGNISMLKSNIVAINAITSDVAVKIQEELENDNESKIYIKLRKFNWY